jgi:ATP-dependent Lhr-like helicase
MPDPTLTNPPDPLAAFLAPTRTWFTGTLGQPTPPQAQGWPAIQRGEHTLILAPTGSGKTLTAFLWGIDQLFHELIQEAPADAAPSAPKRTRRGARVPPAALRLVYISPLKALNNDIERNLRAPLAGIRQAALALGQELPELEVAVRSGDTPSRERQAMLRRPPHILITTPESLYILLTSPRARELFRAVRTVIVDEIHTLAGSKRGVHLALSLERLQAIASEPIQRIGLSATIRPLDEVARYLGGNAWQGAGEARTLAPRPVTVVEATYRKQLDLLVESPVEDFRNVPGGSIWPSIVPRVVDLIDEHRSTLIFVNNRRLAERAADWINEQRAAGPGSLFTDGVAAGLGMMGLGTGTHPDPIRAHHGSVSKEARLALENDLKAGRLPALIGTSSLELGIDIGAVDLVIQLQAPKAVAQGLQRIGRAGHLVGQTSKGRFFPTHREDVMEAAAVAGGMLRGDVEPTHTPRNPLDVLAQQIVAMVSVEAWDADALFDLVRQACAYEDLTPRTWHAVLAMLAGRYPSLAHRELRARLVLDTVNNQLAALPGSRLLAMTNGGTIPDRGAFGAYLPDGKTRLGELDEEFVYETRVGDTFTLGSQVWRVIELTDDKVIVADAAGATPRMPFWRGDYAWRPFELGERVGAFRRAVAERLEALRAALGLAECAALHEHRDEPPMQELLAWLRETYAMDDNCAWIVVDYVATQLDHAGAISSDRTVLVEIFDDALGDPRLVLHSPFGGRVNGLWGIALAAALRERTGVEAEVMSNDDGILFRFPEADADFPLDLVTQLGPAEARERILLELPNSAVFGAQFRQNAARALLLPGLGKGKRTPFWLQRLRARDLLQVVRQYEDFPIVAETYRDCLQEVMDLPHLELVLERIRRGEIQVVELESLTPSPVAQSLLWDFISVYMYEWDAPKAERQLQTLAVNRDLLQDLLKDVDLADLLRPEAVAEVKARLQHTAPTVQARTAEELAYLFQTLGDLSSSEVALRCAADPAGWIAHLAGAGRLVQGAIPTAHGVVSRWVAAEYLPEYGAAFGAAVAEGGGTAPGPTIDSDEARRRILLRFLGQAGPVTLDAVQARYDFPAAWLRGELDRLVAERQIAHGRFTPADGEQAPAPTAEFVDRHTLEQMHRRTLTILRSEVQPVALPVYADFLAHWQHLHPAERLTGNGALRQALQQLRAAPVVGRIWERDVLPLRLAHFQPAELAELCRSGELVWVGSGGVDARRGRVRFLFRGEGSAFLEPPATDLSEQSDLSADAQAVYAFLQGEGAVFQADLRTALDLPEPAVEAALLELVLAGLVTNDSLAALHHIVSGGGPRPAAERKSLSSLEAQLAERRGARLQMGGVRRPGQSEYQAAKRRVRDRLEQASVPVASSPQAGRWALVHRFGILGKALPPAERAARQARQLLARHGVVTHASLDDEFGGWDWGLIYPELQRLELRGEVRRGYFVQGLPGVQFALPEVVERLRAGAGAEDEALVLMNACDPANLYGPAGVGEVQTAARAPLGFARIPSTWLVLRRGLPVLLVEDTGAQMTTMQGADDGVIHRAVEMWLHHVAGFEARVTVMGWNGAPMLGSPGQALLETAGFYRDYPGMTWER